MFRYLTNWLRLSTLKMCWLALSGKRKDLAGTKFYWGYDADGNLIPKTYTDLKTLWIAKTKDTANKLLQPYDWRVIKARNVAPR